MATQNVIKGAIKVKNLPDDACFTTFADLLKSLETYLGVVLPVGDISNVVISTQQPGDSDRDKLWLRRANSGKVIGFYVFSEGKWLPLSPAGNQVFWFYGDHRDPQPGYKFIELGDGVFNSSEYPQFLAQCIKDSTNTFYKYYGAIFIGI